MGFEEDIKLARKFSGDLEKLLGKRKARVILDKIENEVLVEQGLDSKCYSLDFKTGDRLRKLCNLKAYEYLRKRLEGYQDYFSEELYKKLQNDTR